MLYDRASILMRFVFRRHKFTTAHNFEDPFFIIGCGRSGNTLLRSMLVASKQVSIPPESYVWPRIIRRFNAYSFMPWEMLSSMVISEFESYKEFYTWEMNLKDVHQSSRALPKGKRTLSYIINEVYCHYNITKNTPGVRWGDKTPINTIYIDKILKVYPKAQFIHIIRDPLDVVCSYVKAGFYPNYMEAAQFWKAATSKARWLENKVLKSQFIEVSYEKLVSDPKKEMIRICNFLEITYSDTLLEFWKNKEELGDVKFKSHHENVGNPVTKASIGKWKSVLSKNEEKEIRKYLNLK